MVNGRLSVLLLVICVCLAVLGLWLTDENAAALAEGPRMVHGEAQGGPGTMHDSIPALPGR